MNTVIILNEDAKPERVRRALQALGMWTSRLTGRDARLLAVSRDSRAVPRHMILAIEGVKDVCGAETAHPQVDSQRRPFTVGPWSLGAGEAPMLMAGPCSVERVRETPLTDDCNNN